jgi:hypothetical protein
VLSQRIRDQWRCLTRQSLRTIRPIRRDLVRLSRIGPNMLHKPVRIPSRAPAPRTGRNSKDKEPSIPVPNR